MWRLTAPDSGMNFDVQSSGMGSLKSCSSCSWRSDSSWARIVIASGSAEHRLPRPGPISEASLNPNLKTSDLVHQNFNLGDASLPHCHCRRVQPRLNMQHPRACPSAPHPCTLHSLSSASVQVEAVRLNYRSGVIPVLIRLDTGDCHCPPNATSFRYPTCYRFYVSGRMRASTCSQFS